MFKKILVALDDSEPSHNTLSYASEIAVRTRRDKYAFIWRTIIYNGDEVN